MPGASPSSSSSSLAATGAAAGRAGGPSGGERGPLPPPWYCGQPLSKTGNGAGRHHSSRRVGQLRWIFFFFLGGGSMIGGGGGTCGGSGGGSAGPATRRAPGAATRRQAAAPSPDEEAERPPSHQRISSSSSFPPLSRAALAVLPPMPSCLLATYLCPVLARQQLQPMARRVHRPGGGTMAAAHQSSSDRAPIRLVVHRSSLLAHLVASLVTQALMRPAVSRASAAASPRSLIRYSFSCNQPPITTGHTSPSDHPHGSTALLAGWLVVPPAPSSRARDLGRPACCPAAAGLLLLAWHGPLVG